MISSEFALPLHYPHAGFLLIFLSESVWRCFEFNLFIKSFDGCFFYLNLFYVVKLIFQEQALSLSTTSSLSILFKERGEIRCFLELAKLCILGSISSLLIYEDDDGNCLRFQSLKFDLFPLNGNLELIFVFWNFVNLYLDWIYMYIYIYNINKCLLSIACKWFNSLNSNKKNILII